VCRWDQWSGWDCLREEACLYLHNFMGVLREPVKFMRVSILPYKFIYVHKVVVIILANDMMDIADDTPHLFMFMSIRNLDGDM
jgi:hypothetical protein